MKYLVNGTEVIAETAQDAAYLWACDIGLAEAIEKKIDIDPCLQVEVVSNTGTTTKAGASFLCR